MMMGSAAAVNVAAPADLPGLAALVSNLADSDGEDGWLLDACRSPGKVEGCEGLMEPLVDLF
jgi:hypothetical protein